jgi:hypothetical protein
MLFRTFDPAVTPGARVGRPDHDRPIVLDDGALVLVITFGDVRSKN